MKPGRVLPNPPVLHMWSKRTVVSDELDPPEEDETDQVRDESVIR